MEDIARKIRILTIKCIASKGSGHVGGSLSIVDVLTVLYFKYMNVDPNNPKMEYRDRLVVSKGHAGPAVYATLCKKGYIPESELYTLNQLGTNLPSHCDMNKTPGIDMTTGSLGQGVSCAVGIALGSKIRNSSEHIYCIVGDGESQEGQVYEAALFAASRKLNNLILFLDYNHMQCDGYIEEVCDLLDVKKKWEALGFYTQSIDGNNIKEIDKAISNSLNELEKPSMIILNTKKGKGVSFAENAGPGCHSMPITKEMLESALKELGE